MSFYYLKNINFKKQSLIFAPNNVRPLIYKKVAYKEISQDDFIKNVLYSIFLGYVKINNKKSIIKINFFIFFFSLSAFLQAETALKNI